MELIRIIKIMKIDKGILLLILFSYSLMSFPSEKSFKIYKVLKGDKIETISRKFDFPIEEIKRLNPDIDFSNLKENDLVIVRENKEESLLIQSLRNVDNDDDIEIPDVIKDGFIIHSVRKKETKYGISKKYGVSILEINQNNKNTINGLSYHDVIKIPLNEYNKKIVLQEIKNSKKDYNIHIIKKGESLWRLCYDYKITKDQISRINPFINESFKIGDTVFIPKNNNLDQKSSNQEDNYIYYEVQQKDTKYGISKRFGVAISEIDELNPDSKIILKEKTVLKLPNKQQKSPKKDINQINIALMLPFYTSQNLAELQKTNLSQIGFVSKTEIALDYYFGTIQAIEDFKAKNPYKKVEVKVYDTENSLDKIQKILDENSFDNVDFVIGPLYAKNTEYLAKALESKKIPVISPLSDKHILTKITNIVQLMPTDFIFQNKVLNKMIDEYRGENIVIAGTIFDIDKIDFIKEKIISTIKKNSTQDIKYIVQKGDFLVIDSIKTLMDTTKNNILIVPSRDINLTSSAISLANYFNRTEKGISNKVFYLENLDGKNYKQLITSMPSDYFSESNFIYSTSYFADDNKATKEFEDNYKKNNNKLPNKYSYIGYDCANFALNKFVDEGILLKESDKVFRGLTTNFKIEKKINGCYYNSEVIMVRFSKIGIPYVVF